MSISYYMSGFGELFPVIHDDTVFNNMPLNSGQIVNDDGSKTALFDLVAEEIPFSSLVIPAIASDELTINSIRYNRLTSTGVAVKVCLETPPPARQLTDYIMFSDESKYITISRNPYTNSGLTDIRVACSLKVNGSDTSFTATNADVPYGHIQRAQTTSVEQGYISVGVLISNSAKTDWRYVTLIAGQNNQSTVQYVVDFPTNLQISFLTSFFDGLRPYEPPADDDPYGPGGNSGTGGGSGAFDLDSDVIPLPPLPTLSFAATGFTRIYNPTLSELNALANYLWTDATFLDTVINHLKQLLENPMDAVISLALLPCPIPNGSPEAVKVMYINTGVTMAPATTQFVDVDCGTYTLKEFYGSALDYNPYTKVHCYLPYIGQVTLDTDEVMGKTLQVVYRIDIVTGMCAAMILVNQNVLYQFSGHCSINMPINSADFSGYIGAAMTAGKMVAGVVAGAAGAPALAAELIGAPAPQSTTSERVRRETERNPDTGRQVTARTTRTTYNRSSSGASFGEMTRKAVANTVGAVMGSKLTVEHAGGFTGNSGYLAVRRPYLIIERPRMCNPEEYGRYNGRPSMIYMNLGECEGYTEVQSIQFENIPATNPELAELSELLKSGVLF